MTKKHNIVKWFNRIRGIIPIVSEEGSRDIFIQHSPHGTSSHLDLDDYKIAQSNVDDTNNRLIHRRDIS